MGKVFYALLSWFALVAYPADAYSQSLQEQTDELKRQFRDRSGHYVGCWVEDLESCLEGLEKLLAITDSGVFPNRNFTEIYIYNYFGDAGTGGHVIIDHAATDADIENFLWEQGNNLADLELMREQFRERTGHFAFCRVDEIERCIEGMTHLLEISNSSIFPNAYFDDVNVADEFTGPDSGGDLTVAYYASTAEIEEFLTDQYNRFPYLQELTSTLSLQTGHHVACFEDGIEECIVGLEKLEQLLGTGVFTNSRFNSVFISDALRVNDYNDVLIDYRASLAEIEAFLWNQ